MGSRTPVTISRASAEALCDAVARTTSPPAPPTAYAELQAALTDTAERTAWEPLRTHILNLQAVDARLDPLDALGLDQLLAELRKAFDWAGMSLDDPTAIRSILLTVSAIVQHGCNMHAVDVIDHATFSWLGVISRPIAIAAARLVDPEVLA